MSSLAFSQATGYPIANKPTGGSIGSAATTVDKLTTFNINQTTASQTLTIPDLTNNTSGKTIYINNTGTVSFILGQYGTIDTTSGVILRWEGLSWSLCGKGLVSGGSTDTTSLSNRINLKLNATDTLSLSNRIDSKLAIADTAIVGTTAGTVAAGNDSRIGYAMFGVIASFSPVDATTYYFGMYPGGAQTIEGSRSQTIVKTGTITTLYGRFYQSGAGSAETGSLYIRINKTTDYLISSTLTNNGGLTYFNNTSLNIPVTAGDDMEFKWVTPTWVTNPTGVITYLSLFIQE